MTRVQVSVAAVMLAAALQRAVVNGALRGIAIILFIVLIGLFFEKWIEHVLGIMAMDPRRTQTRPTIQIALWKATSPIGAGYFAPTCSRDSRRCGGSSPAA